VIQVTSGCFLRRYPEPEMARKTIAGWMILTIAVWSVMTLAPLLAMHLGHPRPDRASAQNVPGHAHTAMARHACCPKMRATLRILDESVYAQSTPDESHRCCFQQAPSGSPTQAKDSSTRMSVLVSRNVAELRTTSCGRLLAFVAAAGSPPIHLSMVLRI
jgi:hypothetical protein